MSSIVVQIDEMWVASLATDVSPADVQRWLHGCASHLRDELHACHTTPTRLDVERIVSAAFVTSQESR